MKITITDLFEKHPSDPTKYHYIMEYGENSSRSTGFKSLTALFKDIREDIKMINIDTTHNKDCAVMVAEQPSPKPSDDGFAQS